MIYRPFQTLEEYQVYSTLQECGYHHTTIIFTIKKKVVAVQVRGEIISSKAQAEIKGIYPNCYGRSKDGEYKLILIK